MAKYFTTGYVRHLADLDSPLKKAYNNTLYCATELKQDGDKITAKYCKNRWCMVCNRIRVGKCINGYMPELKKLQDPQFVTLTIPNVKAAELRLAIRSMKLAWNAIYKKLHRQLQKMKIKFIGIQKLECTYNADQDNYHPHFHFIIEGKVIAQTIVAEWLDRFPECESIAQHVTKADENSMRELFKYFSKIVTKGAIYVPAMDVIFRSMQGYKVYQPFGIRPVNDEPDDLEAITLEEYADQLTWWKWKHNDWYSDRTGEPISNFRDTANIDKLFDSLIL